MPNEYKYCVRTALSGRLPWLESSVAFVGNHALGKKRLVFFFGWLVIHQPKALYCPYLMPLFYSRNDIHCFTNSQASLSQLPSHLIASSRHSGVVASSSEVKTRVTLRRGTETFFFRLYAVLGSVLWLAVNNLIYRAESSVATTQYWSCETVRCEKDLFCLTNRWW